MAQRAGHGQGVERVAYSVPEFALAVGIGRSLAYELVRRGEVKSFRVHKRVVIPRAEVERWVFTKLQEAEETTARK
ncbi:MAG: helix-turn-helix domain-containing protein [Desulfotomaculales bacterium]